MAVMTRYGGPLVSMLASGAVLALSLAGCSSSSSDAAPAYRLASVAVDEDNDGAPNNLFTWLYDEQGRAVAEELVGNDGSVETRFGRVRNGNTLRIERDEGDDGSVEGVSTWTVDENGLPVSFRLEASAGGDTPQAIDYIAEGGRLVGAEIDDGVDGSIDLTERYRYDEDGLLAGVDFDFDGDGIADDSLEVQRDTSGTVVRLEEDYGNDGGVDFVRTLEYEIGVCDADDVANTAVAPVIDICL